MFEYHDYKKYVNEWIERQPNGGHGQLKAIAEFLGVNSVIMSQVFRGDRDLSLEHAAKLSRYLGLSEFERDYFLLLVQRSRAGTHDLKEIYDQQILAHQRKSKALKNVVEHESLKDEDKGIFYSQWYFSAILLGVSIEELSNVSALAKYFRLDRHLVAEVLDFMISKNIIVKKNGRLDMGPKVTHLEHDSPHVSRHHSNWRLKALQKMDQILPEELFYTGPMALSKSAADEIRKKLVTLIKETTKIAADSSSEKLTCLNIDWFNV